MGARSLADPEGEGVQRFPAGFVLRELLRHRYADLAAHVPHQIQAIDRYPGALQRLDDPFPGVVERDETIAHAPKP